MSVKLSAALAVCISLFLLSQPVVGEELKRRVLAGDVKINYRFMDEASAAKEAEISKLVAQGYTAYANLFGGLPRNLSGSEYREISIQVRNQPDMGGEADPGLIILKWNEGQLFGLGSWQTLLLHELFHLWSAESFRYKDGQEHWFNEGVTEYYAFKTAVQLGLVSADSMLSKAALPIGYYSSSKGIGEISMREAGKTNKTKFDNYFLVYHGGWVVAMTIDHEIRERTDGKKSLDDLMRWMYEHFPRHRKLYTFSDIINGLKAVTNADYTDFLSRYVDGVERIPVSEYFPLSDAIWAFTFNPYRRSEYRSLYQTLGIPIAE